MKNTQDKLRAKVWDIFSPYLDYENYTVDISLADEALEAINSLVIGVVGAQEAPATEEFGLNPDEVFMPSDLIREIRNGQRTQILEDWFKGKE